MAVKFSHQQIFIKSMSHTWGFAGDKLSQRSQQLLIGLSLYMLKEI